VEIPEFEGKTGKFVENREQLMSVDVANTDYLLGKDTKVESISSLQKIIISVANIDTDATVSEIDEKMLR